jgi:hypothetical protein
VSKRSCVRVCALGLLQIEVCVAGGPMGRCAGCTTSFANDVMTNEPTQEQLYTRIGELERKRVCSAYAVRRRHTDGLQRDAVRGEC